MKRFVPLSLALSLLVSACAQEQERSSAKPSRPSSAVATSQPSRTDLHASFDALLKQHVRKERVDYLALRDNDKQILVDYLSRLASVDLKKLSQAEQLAFYINLYNASMIAAVVDRYVAGYSPSAKNFEVFSAPLVHLGGKSISLNHLENEIIRKQFSEPRIHVALVCGAKSCPPLLPRAYRAEDLEVLLERGMKRFVNDSTRNTLTAKKVAVSKIFEWYAADFGKSGVLAYIRRYAAIDVSKAELGYRDYQWALNLTAPQSGEWVQVTKAQDGLKKGEVLRVIGRKDGKVKLQHGDSGSVSVSSQFIELYRFKN